MRPIAASKISLVIERSRADAAFSVIRRMALPLVSVQNLRSVRLGSSLLPRLPGAKSILEEAPADLLCAWVEPSAEEAVMEALRSACALDRAGAGSLFCQRVSVVHPALEALPTLPRFEGEASKRFGKLTGVLCIVQRGQGNLVARSVLEMGLSVPVVGYGTGMGIRNKLGLIRVTIPSGKETILFLTAPSDAAEAVALISDAIGLDIPGRGFIYTFPVVSGMADTLLRRAERESHVASMEQVIAAVDELSGGTFWRRRSAAPGGAFQQLPSAPGGRRRQTPGTAPSVCLTLSCLEGHAEEHVQAAMDLGAGGATLSRCVHIDFSAHKERREPRENSDLVIRADLADPIVDALAFTGFFSPDCSGIAEVSPVSLSASFNHPAS